MVSQSAHDDTVTNPGVLSEDVGHRIRAFREMRALSLRALGARADVSSSFLSQLENGRTSASVSSLRRISSALGITIADLFDPELRHPRTLLRSVDRPQLPMEAGSRKYVISQAPLRNVEIYVAEFDPGASTGDQLYAHGDAQEFLIVQRGEITFYLGSESHAMARGDSIEYASSLAHGVSNAGSEVAEIVWVTSPPTLEETTVGVPPGGHRPARKQ